MIADGLHSYREFYRTPPLLIVEWRDSESEAVGWLVINSLRNGAAGGGTRMRCGASCDEAVALAKTMEIKFNVTGPPIGGAKSVINFNPEDPRKKSVLRRWFESIGPYLKHHYGTAGDFGVDETEFVLPIMQEVLGLKHPQEGIIRGYMKADELLCNRVLHKLGKTLNKSVNLGSAGSFKVTASITGFGVARSLYHYCRLTEQTLEGKRVLIEGFGNVAGLAACYIDRAGAKVVGVITRRDEGFQIARSGCGLDITDLICRRNNQRYLPAEYPYCDCSDEFWQTEADVFLTATSSRSITAERLAQLKTLGVQVIIGAANFPFAESSPGETCVQESADRMFSVIPDFIANCGKARAFSYLMDEPEDLTPSAIFKDVDWTIRQTMEAVLGCTDGERTGLLNSAYTLYVEKPVYTM